MKNMETKLLDIKNLSFEVNEDNTSKTIINDLNLQIESGKFIVITGPNGGGKSTLARLIAGINTASSGTIEYEGQDITNMSITDRAKVGISFAFQQPVRFKGITVFDLIKLASGNKALSVGDACKYLSEVGLCAKDYVNREVNASLPGGELKRIEIATVLARNAKYLIFDEPEAGIDLWSFTSLIDTFSNLKKDDSHGLLIISHQERILKIADEIVVVTNGKITGMGSSEEVLPAILKDGFSAACPLGKEMC